MAPFRIRFLWLSLLFCLQTDCLKADHLATANLSFTYLGIDSYYIELKVYRDCKGIGIDDIAPVSLLPTGCSFITSQYVSLKRTSSRSLDFTCSKELSICSGGNFPFGVEENVYGAYIHLKKIFGNNLSNSCCLINVVYTNCCRSSNITNGFGNNRFSINAEINRCIAGGNSSPLAATEPIALLCNNQPFCYNNQFADTKDRDSIAISFESPFSDYNQPLSWPGNFSEQSPFYYLQFPDQDAPYPAGFHLDQASGDICFQSTQPQRPVISVRVTEWRKINGRFTKVGSLKRDIQFYTINCSPNQPPVILVNDAVSNPAYVYMCAGEQNCINLKAKDADNSFAKSDTTMLFPTSIPPYSTFNNKNNKYLKRVREDEATLCWRPGYNHISSLPHAIIITAEDNSCPIKKVVTQKLFVYVGAKPYLERSYLKTGCFNMQFISELINPDQTGTSLQYSWTVSAKPDGKFYLPGAPNYQSAQVARHHFNQPGRYVIRFTAIAPACQQTWFDTVVVDAEDNNPAFDVHAGNDTSVCALTPIYNIQAYPMSGSFKSIDWWIYPFCAGCIIHDPLTASLSFKPPTVTIPQTYTLVLKATDISQCSKSDTAYIVVNPLPSGEFFSSLNDACKQAEIKFNTTFQNANSYLWNFGDSTQEHTLKKSTQHLFSKSGNYTISLIVTSSEGCKISQNKPEFIRIHNEPKASFIADKYITPISQPDFSFQNTSNGFMASDSISFLWDFGDPLTNTDVSQQTSPHYTYPSEPGSYEVKLTAKTKFGCEDTYQNLVRITPDFTLFIPDAFRPASSNPQTQKFQVIADYFESFHLLIFNRWGQLIHESTNINDGWDGTLNGAECAPDVYAWKIKATAYDKTYNYAGTVNLIR